MPKPGSVDFELLSWTINNLNHRNDLNSHICQMINYCFVEVCPMIFQDIVNILLKYLHSNVIFKIGFEHSLNEPKRITILNRYNCLEDNDRCVKIGPIIIHYIVNN